MLWGRDISNFPRLMRRFVLSFNSLDFIKSPELNLFNSPILTLLESLKIYRLNWIKIDYEIEYESKLLAW